MPTFTKTESSPESQFEAGDSKDRNHRNTELLDDLGGSRLSINRCRKLLGPRSQFSDEQVAEIRESLYTLAFIYLDGYDQQNTMKEK